MARLWPRFVWTASAKVVSSAAKSLAAGVGVGIDPPQITSPRLRGEVGIRADSRMPGKGRRFHCKSTQPKQALHPSPLPASGAGRRTLIEILNVGLPRMLLHCGEAGPPIPGMDFKLMAVRIEKIERGTFAPVVLPNR